METPLSHLRPSHEIPHEPLRIVVMGVTGCGKTTVASRLAAAIGARFCDGDSLHSPENVDKMRRGEALGLDVAWLADAQRLLPPADLTLVLDIAPETSLERKRAARDRFERDLPLLARVRDSYRRQAQAPAWHLIDGARAQETVRHEVATAVRARLGLL